MLTLFALAWIACCVRFYIRVRIQKQLSIDDGFLLFGLGCLSSAIGVLFTFIDDIYTSEAFSLGDTSFQFTPTFLEQSNIYHLRVTVVLMLSWCAIGSVKLSYLFLFRRLVDRLPRMMLYWWFALTFNLAVIGYGIAVYYVACPYYFTFQQRECLVPYQ